MQVWLDFVFVLLLGLFSFLANSIRFLAPAFVNTGAHTSICCISSLFLHMYDLELTFQGI